MKKKSENSYSSLFRQKNNLSETRIKETIDQPKKGINFEEIEDWQPIKSNSLSESNQENKEKNFNNNETPSNERNNQLKEIMQNFGLHYKKEENNNDIDVSPNNNFPKKQNNQEITILNKIDQLDVNKVNNDEFSVNTSYFTNRFGDINNNVDKIELSQMNNNQGDFNFSNFSQTNISNKKFTGFLINSNENIGAINPKNYPIIEEKDEEDLKINQSLQNKSEGFDIKNIDDDSLEDEGFSFSIGDDLNVTKNQLDDMKKEMKDINRKIKIKEKKEEIKLKNSKETPKKKIVLEPILNNRQEVKNKPKRKHSPYLRNNNAINATNAINNNINKPISIGTYQQNTNIMHIQPPFNSLPHLYYPNPNSINIQNFNPNLIPAQNFPPNYAFPPWAGNLNNYSNNTNAQNIPPAFYYSNPINNVLSINQPDSSKKNSRKFKSEKSMSSERKKSSNYKTHSLQDYKEKMNKIKSESVTSRGLGPNIGTKEWQEKFEKNNKIKEYAKSIKIMNSNPKTYSENENFETKESIKSDKEISSLELEKNLKELRSNTSKVLKLDRQDYPCINRPGSTNKSGYSHIHNIKKLKTKRDDDELSLNTPEPSFVRPKSSARIEPIKLDKTKEKRKNDKIYTTLNTEKKVKKANISCLSEITTEESKIELSNIRANSSHIRKPKEVRRQREEIDILVNNHNYYRDQVEKIKNFINKV
jgi:hypothetical protein